MSTKPPSAPYGAPPQQPYGAPYGAPVAVVPQQPVQKVRHWLPWSIVNIFLGFIVLGVVPLILSLVTRNYIKHRNYDKAKTFGIFALITNILATLIALGTWAVIIYYIVIAAITAAAVAKAVRG